MKNHQYIKTLDGWRAVAIVAVILSHVKDSLFPASSTLYKVLSHGGEGVSLFFAISGYIISVKLFSEFDKTGSIDLKSFYTRRIFRLLPATLFYLAFLVILKMSGLIKIDSLELWSTLFFWRNYYPVEGLHLTGHFWSLSVEEHFYLFFPAFLLFLKTQKKILWGILILGLWVSIWRKIGSMDSVVSIFPFAKYSLHYTMGRLDGLLFGAMLAFVQRNFAGSVKILQKIPPIMPILLFLCLVALPIPLRPTWKAMLFPILIFTTMTHEESLISKFLELRFMIFIGKISYSLYVWHTLFVYKNELAPLWMQSFLGGWISIVPAFIVAYLSYRYIETPLRNVGIKLSTQALKKAVSPTN